MDFDELTEWLIDMRDAAKDATVTVAAWLALVWLGYLLFSDYIPR